MVILNLCHSNNTEWMDYHIWTMDRLYGTDRRTKIHTFVMHSTIQYKNL